MSKLPPLIKKKLQKQAKKDSSSTLCDLDFYANKVEVTYDLVRILQIHLDSLLNSTFEGIPYLRSTGVDFSSYLFSLGNFEVKNIEARLRRVFSQSSLFELVSVNDISQVDTYTIEVSFTLKIKTLDRLVSLRAVFSKGQPAQLTSVNEVM